MANPTKRNPIGAPRNLRDAAQRAFAKQPESIRGSSPQTRVELAETLRSAVGLNNQGTGSSGVASTGLSRGVANALNAF